MDSQEAFDIAMAYLKPFPERPVPEAFKQRLRELSLAKRKQLA